jgi:hypothetical protein
MKDAVYLRGWDWCINKTPVRDYQHHSCWRNMHEKHCTNRWYYRIPSIAVYAYISKRKCPTFKGPRPLLWAGTRAARAKIKRSGTPNRFNCIIAGARQLDSSGLSICMSVWYASAPTRRIFVKFDIRVFFENLSKKNQFIKTGQE